MSSTRAGDLNGCGHALRLFGRHVKAGLSASFTFVRETTSASYHILGQHTYPRDEFIHHPSTKKITDLNKIGIVLLAPVALVSMGLSVTLFPLIGNSYQSFVQTYIAIVNLPLFDLPQEKFYKQNAPGIANSPDQRSWLRHLYGMPGCILGVVTAVPSAAVIVGTRVVTNTWTTGKRAFLSIANLVNYPHSLGESLEQNDQRHWLRKYFMGIAGLPLGLTMGVIVTPALFFLRVVRETWETAKRTLFSAIKMAAFPHKVDVNGLEQNDQRYMAEKYGFGGPGFFMGAAAGIVAAIGIGAARFVLETTRSWKALSGSLLNGALERPTFCGIGGDTRSKFAKVAGGLGYIVALATTVPLAATTYLLRQVPALISHIIGFAVSPFIFTGKIISRSLTQEPIAADPIVQKLRNLQSSLTMQGRFKPDVPLATDGTEKESIGSILRKSMTFNKSTPTEKIITTFFKKYRKFIEKDKGKNHNVEEEIYPSDSDMEINENDDLSKNQNIHLGVIADRVRRSVKKHYQETCYSICCSTPSESREIEEEMNNIVDFILDYLKDKKDRPGQNIYKQKSWFLTFRGVASRDEDPYVYRRIQPQAF